MKVFLTLALLLSWMVLRAQPATTPAVYTDSHSRYQLVYPRTWLLRKQVGAAEALLVPADLPGTPQAQVTLTVRALPDGQRDQKLTARTDTVLGRLRQLPQAQILGFEQHDFGSYDELRYDYSYVPRPPATPLRLRVVSRQIWRAGYEFRVEYRAERSQDGRYLAEGRQVVESFAFTTNALPSRRYADQVCDNKMYGIAALRFFDGHWEDDCRSIHEFSASDISGRTVVHSQVLPFQSYALTKGFDNCLYSVTKAPTNSPELIYRYDPALHKGSYTSWQLPAQGQDNVWISAATDEHGDLLFLTSDANQLVKVSPHDGSVTVQWKADPMRKAPFYNAIGFSGAGTHGNFCFDDGNIMYMVYSTDGSLLKINMLTKQALPEQMPLTGLPARGGYSDLLMQNDAAGRRRMYLAGPHALYEVDLARRRAKRLRSGVYTDLAGCNLFQVVPRPVPAPPPPTTATWRGRVLDAGNGRPLPEAQLQLELAGATTTTAVLVTTAQASFSFATTPGRTFQYHAQLPGYFPTDSTWTAAPGPVVRDILLRPLTVGTTFKLANVQFEQGRAVLLPLSYTALTKLVALLIDNPRLTIELRGHTDNVGPAEKNVVLSQQRVAGVRAYLAEHGISAARIVGLGLGGAQPIASNEQEATRQLNRRVEFRILSLQ